MSDIRTKLDFRQNYIYNCVSFVTHSSPKFLSVRFSDIYCMYSTIIVTAIRKCTRLGKDFENLKLNFNTERNTVVKTKFRKKLNLPLVLKNVSRREGYNN